jgi:hypothetical protein
MLCIREGCLVTSWAAVAPGCYKFNVIDAVDF